MSDVFTAFPLLSVHPSRKLSEIMLPLKFLHLKTFLLTCCIYRAFFRMREHLTHPLMNYLNVSYMAMALVGRL